MKNLFILLIASALTLIGCGDIVTSEQKRTITVYGESPEQFFSKFMYQRTDDCSVDLRFRYLMGNDIELKSALDGSKVIGFFRVFLYANHQFSVDFEAQKISRSRYNVVEYSVAQQIHIEGKWHIDGNGRLVLPNVGVGQAVMENGEKGVLLYVKSDFTNRLAQKRTVTLAMRLGNVGPAPDCAVPDDDSQTTYEPSGEASQTSHPSLPML